MPGRMLQPALPQLPTGHGHWIDIKDTAPLAKTASLVDRVLGRHVGDLGHKTVLLAGLLAWAVSQYARIVVVLLACWAPVHFF